MFREFIPLFFELSPCGDLAAFGKLLVAFNVSIELDCLVSGACSDDVWPLSTFIELRNAVKLIV